MNVRSRPHPLALLVVAVATVSVVSFGLLNGMFVAAAADAYGYVSQADLWARGSLVVAQPFAREMTWPGAADSLAPLGYRPHRPAPHGTDIVPIYSPGVPMLMAAFKLIGGANAVYWVVPLLGGLALWATFVMGLRLAGSFVGASAAVLLATSPSFLFEVTAPASDVGATAWWAVTLALLTFGSARAAFGAGLAASAAILTRPNLAPLAVLFGLTLAWRALTPRRPETEERDSRSAVLWFAAGVLPGILAVAFLNQHLYGSPLKSGYGTLEELYAWEHGWANLARYPRWVVESQTPLVLLALAAPFVLPPTEAAGSGERRPRATAAMWLCGILMLFGLYLFYLPFEEWWYVRFIMPMFPPLFVLMAVSLITLLGLRGRLAPQVVETVAALMVGLLAWHGVRYATDRGASEVWRAEQRYLEAGEYVRSTLPERAAIISMQHSGSVRFYSGRVSVRYDLLRPTDLDLVVAELRRLGYEPYLLLDDWEEAIFRERFGGHSALGTLKQGLIAAPFSGRVRVYELAANRS
jgi:hypothetical protein